MDLNELKKKVEARGTKWADALERLEAETDGKSIQEAIAEGWTVEDFQKILLSGEPEGDEPKGDGQPEKQAQPEARSSVVTHHEAPASLNTYYISPGGFRWQFTIRPGLAAEEMTALLERAKKAEEWLTKKGYKPYVPFKTNNANASQQAGGNGGEPDSKVCPVHHVAMQKREKHGETWWSHKAINPETNEEYWCKGGAK